jgi:hypothetical protein
LTLSFGDFHRRGIVLGTLTELGSSGWTPEFSDRRCKDSLVSKDNWRADSL